jgi:membrane-associated phospholipid phosphatase
MFNFFQLRTKISLIAFVLFSFFVDAHVYQLNGDSAVVRNKSNYKWRQVVLVPSIFLGAGLIATTDNEVFDRFNVNEERQKYFPKFHTNIDDYLQFAPVAAVYGLTVAGIKGEHDFLNTTILLLKTEMIMTAMVLPLKKLTAVGRPDTGAKNSFPSGHTAEAFAAATFLHKEYGRDHPLYSALAYTSAFAVGTLRVLNHRHWVSDVMAGAGLGILSANLAYATHKNKWGLHHSSRRSHLVMTPTYSQGAVGMYVLLKLN